VRALADMSDVERKLALERYKLLERHLQNGRELRSVSAGSNVSLTALVGGDERVRNARREAVTAAHTELELYTQDISVEVVEAARDSIVIGQA
jgi:hypothetical protein